ncbi:glycoside hydrolase [Mucilaginibacter limnophilus]|uniref:Glycoside hydrolase n=1 Tax=Mucilaginibacter limnophilus TaxID=1932778 RepID=A0A3S2V7K2_9SPHI|nr:NlpC/P60 family protein [Mucilaginibacter limnophilus]RVU00477.1 glycoside hydrolase [Mucilaginibacter limnophilus]
MQFRAAYCLLVLFFLSCGGGTNMTVKQPPVTADTTAKPGEPLPFPYNTPEATRVNTGQTTPAQLITYAQTLQGIPYKYGSINPNEGFDCSGFITYVFNHFGIAVPRTSEDFTNVHHEIPLRNAKPGDLILFTGTDSTIRTVGHMGIIVTAPGQPTQFIHSTSGKNDGVTITPLNAYYMGRYVKTVRVFPQNER